MGVGIGQLGEKLEKLGREADWGRLALGAGYGGADGGVYAG